jgi:hypothetical protein
MIKEIAEYAYFREQIKLKKMCKYLNDFIDVTHLGKSHLDDNILIKYPKIIYLHVTGIDNVQNFSIAKLKKLRILRFYGNKSINNNDFVHLSNLQVLYLDHRNNIDNNGIKYLINLKALYCKNDKITYDGLRYLVNLEKLMTNYIMKDSDIECLSNLKKIIIQSRYITINGIKKLKKLQVVYMMPYSTITKNELTKIGIKMKKK